MMQYAEFPPAPALARYVACFWTSEVQAPLMRLPRRIGIAAGGASRVCHRVLPDNCIDILWQDSGAAFAVGMMSTFVDVPVAGPVRTVAVRFLPGAASLFLRAQPAGRSGAPLAALADLHADLDLLWSRSDADQLADALWTADIGDRARLALIETALLARLALASGAARSGLAQARHAVTAIEAAGGALRVEALADSMGVTRQHLSAQFREQVGLSPKLFARIARFRKALAAASRHRAAPSPAAVDWADLAATCGYFDQSHLIRDFQHFAGAAPDTWLNSR